MIMDLLGESLEGLLVKYRRFSVKTVLMLAIQMVDRIRTLHSIGYLHRDIKPDNFSIGIGEQNYKIYLFDFGLAKRYLKKDKKHIPLSIGKTIKTDTAVFSSINAHRGFS